MNWDATTEATVAVELRTLRPRSARGEPGQRFRVIGLGNRTGELLRLTDTVALVQYDGRRGEPPRPVIGVSLRTRVIPL